MYIAYIIDFLIKPTRQCINISQLYELRTVPTCNEAEVKISPKYTNSSLHIQMDLYIGHM